MKPKIIRRLNAIYASLPLIKCKGLCQESCGPIMMEQREAERIEKQIGEIGKCGQDLTCPLLKDGKCSVYQLRPAICRLWGVTEEMPCPFGCKPVRYLNKAEAADFLDRVRKVAGGDGNMRGTVDLDSLITALAAQTEVSQ